MSQIFKSNLDGFQKIAAAGASRIYLKRGQAGQPGHLTAQRLGLKGRVVQWFKTSALHKFYSQGSIDNVRESRAAHEHLSAVLEKNYGREVAKSAMKKVDFNQRRNRPLSSALVRQVLKNADEQSVRFEGKRVKGYGIFRNKAFSRSENNFQKMGKEVLGQARYGRLPKEDLKVVDRYVLSRLKTDPRFSKVTMKENEYSELLREAFTWFKSHGGASGTLKSSDSEPLRGLLRPEDIRLDPRANRNDLRLKRNLMHLAKQSEISIGRLDELLEKVPTNEVEMSEWKNECDTLVGKISDEIHALEQIQIENYTSGEGNFQTQVSVTSGKLLETLQASRNELFQQREYNLHFFKEHPLRADKVKEASSLWLQSARIKLDECQNIMNIEQPRGWENQKTLRAIGQVKQSLDNLENRLQISEGDSESNMTAKEAKTMERDAAATSLKAMGQLKKAFQEDRLLRIKLPFPQESLQLKRELLDQREKLLKANYYGDGISEERVDYQLGDRKIGVENKTTLGKAIFQGTSIKNNYTTTDTYVAASANFNSPHLPNLAITELSESGTTEPFFQAVRHGVITTGQVDIAARENLMRGKTREMLQAALLANPKAMREAEAASRSGQTLDLPIVSVSLLTAINLAKFKESDLLDSQLSAFEAANKADAPITLEVPRTGQTPLRVSVRPRIIAFNLGVNEAAVQLNIGWNKVRQLNEKSLETLIGRTQSRGALGGLVGEALNNPNTPLEERQQIQELATQIRNIWQNESYKKNDGDIYKLQSRIALLSYKLGATPMWNCKSGKDRTSHMDAEVKALATRAHFRGDIAQPGELGGGSQKLLQAFAFRGPSHWIQRLSTGYGGYKTYNAVERTAAKDPFLEKAYIGGASFTKS